MTDDATLGSGRVDDETGVDAARIAELLEASSGPVDWRSLGSDHADVAWTDLRAWVDWARTEFVLDHRVVPPCWYRHPALVSVLSALHDHWRSAYDPLGSLLGPSDWHRALMQIEHRLREWASRTGCTAAAHRPDVVMQYPDDAPAWAEHVAADVAARAEREAEAAPSAVDTARSTRGDRD